MTGPAAGDAPAVGFGPLRRRNGRRSRPASSDPRSRETRLAVRLAEIGGMAALAAVPFLILMLLVIGKSAAVMDVDRSVADALHRQALGSPGLVRTLDVLAVVLHPNTFRLAVFAAAIALWWRRRHLLAVFAGVTMTVGGLLGGLVKLAVERARPVFPDSVASAAGYSFPSGHALNALLGMGILLLLALPHLGSRAARVAAWLAAVGVVGLTGYDRVALGVHFLSDVVGGWIMGLAVLLGTTSAFGAWRRGRTPAEGVVEADPKRADVSA